MGLKMGQRSKIMRQINSPNDEWFQNTVGCSDVPNIFPSASYNSALLNIHSNIYERDEIPTLNVRAWIEEYDMTNRTRKVPLLGVLDSGIIQSTDRQELVRIVCAKILKINDNMYPSSHLKTQLAQEIVNAFPKLRSLQSTEGYEHFYDQKTNSGFIQYRLKNMRLKLPTTEKKRRSRNIPCERDISNVSNASNNKETTTLDSKLIDDLLFNEKCTELMQIVPNEANKPDIIKLLDETRANRQRFIKNSHNLTVANILKQHPRLIDYNGEMICREFMALYPNNENQFLSKFSSFYAPRILQFCRIKKEHLLDFVAELEDDNLKALLLLPELLPSPNYMKRKKPGEIASYIFARKEIPNRNLLQFVQSREDLNILFNAKRAENVPIQPCLICCQSGRERKGEFYINADGESFSVGYNAILAFDILLKLHYCFDVHFAPELTNFYDFITSVIMGLQKPKSCCIALDVSLRNLGV